MAPKIHIPMSPKIDINLVPHHVNINMAPAMKNFKPKLPNFFGQRQPAAKQQNPPPTQSTNPSSSSTTASGSPQDVATTGPTIVPSLYDAHSTTAPPAGTSFSTHQTFGSTTQPKKYIKINGVTKLNPEFKRWREMQGKLASTAMYPDQALAVVSSMDDHEKYCEASVAAGGKDVPLAESTAATIEILQDPDVTLAAGMQADEMVDELGAVLNKWEVPMGLMNKLIMLTELDGLEFIIDDSGSMLLKSDTVDPNNRPQSRWQEAQSRLKAMIEIVAYVPSPQITICFLNRRDQIILTRNGSSPKVFLQDSYTQIDRAFQSGPQGTTPVLEKLKESLARGAGRSIARYLFCDGEPNGGNPVKAEIIQLLLHRKNPEGNPITFLSCTGDDSEAEWMKDAEEIIPFCAECDDFKDEAEEVYKDQGAALPYTFGFYLICSLVAAMNPDDLDAMDESVPFTKTTLDNLLGIEHEERAYRHYFDCFLQAQRARTIGCDGYGRPKRTDQIKKDFNWQALYQDFLQAPLASQIPVVQQFKKQLKL